MHNDLLNIRQAGVIFGSKRRARDEVDHLIGLFTNILGLSEERGPFATGIVWVNRDGQHKISKLALPASEFILDKAFAEVINDIDNSTNLLMGHTRWPTRGDISNIANSQPKRTGVIVATHNGTVVNADWLFRRFKLPRHAEVDSEVIFRFADEAVGQDGRINVQSLAQRLAFCKGSLAAVMVAKTDPGRVIMIRCQAA